MTLRLVVMALCAMSCAPRSPLGSPLAPSTVSTTAQAIYAAVLDSILPGERAMMLHPIRHVGRDVTDTLFAGFFVVRRAATAPTDRILWGPAVGLPGDAELRGTSLARFREVHFLADSTRAAVAFQLVACDGPCGPESLAWLGRDRRLMWRIDSVVRGGRRH